MDDFMKKYNLAMLGTGDIANFHIEAFRRAGFQVNMCASRENSKNAEHFAKTHSIENCYGDPHELIEDHKNWDVILLAIKTEQNPQYLAKIFDLNKLCLIEKPVSINLKLLESYNSFSNAKIRVAYNRRFYKTIQIAKEFIKNNSPVTCRMELPEYVNYESINKYEGVLGNSVHGIDLLRYLFGELEIITNTKLYSPAGRICILKSDNKDKIDLLLNWNSPSNFSLNIEADGKRLELKPFETVKLFQGMNIIEPTDDLPIRRYIPNVIEESTSFPSKNSNFKPGFVEQAIEMKSILEGNKPKISAGLIDAYKVQQITQSILFD
jgi:predicted dehydrogenase